MATEIVQGEKTDVDTGEVLEEEASMAKEVARYQEPARARHGMALMSMDQVAALVSPEQMEQHRKVMAAYDEAVGALIGPNDEQEIGNNKFKKKSGWKKLARVFHVDTEIISVDGAWEWDPDEEVHHYNARAFVRGIAPWGQKAEEFGGCSTRETRFYMSYPACPQCGGPMWDNRGDNRGGAFKCKDRGCARVLNEGEYEPARIGEHVPNPTLRAKAMHDCEATAVTRASNRATSALIAAGEVSAEEVEGGQSVRRAASSAVQGGQPQGGENGEEPDPATGPQVMLIARMTESHVITEEERQKFAAAIAKGMTKKRAGESIEWLQREIKGRKEAEKKETEEAGQEYADPDPDYMKGMVGS